MKSAHDRATCEVCIEVGDECTACGTTTNDLWLDPNPAPEAVHAQWCRDCARDRFELPDEAEEEAR